MTSSSPACCSFASTSSLLPAAPSCSARSAPASSPSAMASSPVEAWDSDSTWPSPWSGVTMSDTRVWSSCRSRCATSMAPAAAVLTALLTFMRLRPQPPHPPAAGFVAASSLSSSGGGAGLGWPKRPPKGLASPLNGPGSCSPTYGASSTSPASISELIFCSPGPVITVSDVALGPSKSTVESPSPMSSTAVFLADVLFFSCASSASNASRSSSLTHSSISASSTSSRKSSSLSDPIATLAAVLH
mmetsp:Transcript_19789/g.37762  ORF Transcript_19789/g.37762 Transcript_19789/m.37762 type:complete len:245 (+) Transcript_19789:2082-2816(+)